MILGNFNHFFQKFIFLPLMEKFWPLCLKYRAYFGNQPFLRVLVGEEENSVWVIVIDLLFHLIFASDHWSLIDDALEILAFHLILWFLTLDCFFLGVFLRVTRALILNIRRRNFHIFNPKMLLYPKYNFLSSYSKSDSPKK